MLAEQGGEFIFATARHHMACMLAVDGSGAARRSYDDSTRFLNIDIGGGTTKLGLIENGELRATAAVHLGGRLRPPAAARRVPARHLLGAPEYSVQLGRQAGLEQVALP